MKTIKLIKLALSNFQGGNFTLDASGEDADVYGSNAAGKTRLMSAFSWLLFDKDSLGRSDFSLKNLDATGAEEHMLEHTVEAVLDVDGEQITLRKVYKETWTKKRGSATDTFTGHTNDFYINGVPVQKKDFQSRIAEIAGDESTFRLLTSPTAFPALDWKKQRTLLLDIVGDMTDADVIATDSALEPLSDIIAKHKSSKTPLDDHKKIVAARRAEINKSMLTIPARIDEQRRSLPDVTGIDRAALSLDVFSLEGRINEANLRLQGVDNGSAISALSKQLAEVGAEIQKLETLHFSETMKTGNRLMQQVSELSIQRSNDLSRVDSIAAEIKRKTASVEKYEGELISLRTQYAAISAEEFRDGTPDTCSACNQPLPTHLVHDAREKALATFNNDKANRLTDNQNRGRRMAEDRNQIQAEIATLTTERDTLTAGIPEIQAKLAQATTDRDTVRSLAENYDTIPERTALLEKKAAINQEMTAAKSGISEDSAKIRTEIATLKAQLTTAKDGVDKFVRRESGEKRIEELKAEEKTLAAEYERLEHELYLIEQFVRTKVSLLTDRINSRFEMVRFKLFSEQINGGLSECCEITVNGVPFGSGLNNAGRIQAGCDVIRTLQQYYNLSAPLIVDNRESVTKLPEMGCQVISLIVSENDPVLRVETARKLVAA